jgi:tRNA threonylcarbamoyladenosine biosynthesis protein TsaB
MALLLNIETATSVCSVALSQDERLVALKENLQSRSHAESLAFLIEDVFKEAGLHYSAIDAVAISMGPGSYTGLRIGVSTAKGLCLALEKPLIAIHTLQIMARKVSEKYTDSDLGSVLFCPLIDARRMEVYTALYDAHNKEVKACSADIIDTTSFLEVIKNNRVVFFGDGAEKCKAFLKDHGNTIFIDGVFPSAVQMGALSYEAFSKSEFVDVAYFEPFYLKDFYSPPPKTQ